MKFIQTQIRHFLTFLAGLGTFLLTHGLLSAEAADQVNALGADAVEPLALFLGAIAAGLARWVMLWAGKQFPLLANVLGSVGDNEDGKASGAGVVPLAFFFLCAGALMLPSCSSEYPLTGSISYRDPNSGAKGGLVFTPGEAPRASVRIPVYDEDGFLIGLGELSGPLAGTVKPQDSSSK